MVDGAAAFDAEGNLYVADLATAASRSSAPTGLHHRPGAARGRAMASSSRSPTWPIDGQGRVFVTDRGSGRHPGLRRRRPFPDRLGRRQRGAGWLPQPAGITVDADGNLWIAHFLDHRVQKYSPDGTLLATLGGFGTVTGQFSKPSDVAVDRWGRVYVAEWGNHRVQVFDGEGQFLATWGSVGHGARGSSSGRTASSWTGRVTPTSPKTATIGSRSSGSCRRWRRSGPAWRVSYPGI